MTGYRSTSVIVEYVYDQPARLVGWLVDDREWARWLRHFYRHAPRYVHYEWMSQDDFLDRFVGEEDD